MLMVMMVMMVMQACEAAACDWYGCFMGEGEGIHRLKQEMFATQQLNISCPLTPMTGEMLWHVALEKVLVY